MYIVILNIFHVFTTIYNHILHTCIISVQKEKQNMKAGWPALNKKYEGCCGASQLPRGMDRVGMIGLERDWIGKGIGNDWIGEILDRGKGWKWLDWRENKMFFFLCLISAAFKQCSSYLEIINKHNYMGNMKWNWNEIVWKFFYSIFLLLLCLSLATAHCTRALVVICYLSWQVGVLTKPKN